MEVADYLGREVLGDLVKGMAPYAGILTSGANAIFQFGKLAQAASRRMDVHDCRSAVREGDPDKAVIAIERVLSRDITRRATQGTMAGFEAIARGASTALGGPAAETIAAGVMSIAKLTFQVYIIGRDFQEKAQANDIMSGAEPVTYTVFDKYPLLGCYYVGLRRHVRRRQLHARRHGQRELDGRCREAHQEDAADRPDFANAHRRLAL